MENKRDKKLEPTGPSTYVLKPGYVWNPLTKYRNVPCPCHSGRKAKACCGRHAVMPEDVADKVMRALIYEGYAD